MNIDQQLKLQSYLDGELSAREAQEVADWLKADAEARALFTELQNTTAALEGNELEVKLPESRDFYFSKIRRQIEQESARSETVRPISEPLVVRLRKFLLPLAGAAAAVILFAVMSSTQPGLTYVPAEGETSSEMAAYTYRSQSDRLTVVWLADNNSASANVDDSESSDFQ